MANLRDTYYDVLANDPTLIALATGGIHSPSTLGRFWVEIQDLQSDPNNPIIQPGIFLKFTSIQNYSFEALEAEQVYFEVWFMQHQGYDTIELMREQVRQLFDGKRFDITVPSGMYVFKTIWTGDLLTLVDDALSGISVERSRYEVHTRRNV